MTGLQSSDFFELCIQQRQDHNRWAVIAKCCAFDQFCPTMCTPSGELSIQWFLGLFWHCPSRVAIQMQEWVSHRWLTANNITAFTYLLDCWFIVSTTEYLPDQCIDVRSLFVIIWEMIQGLLDSVAVLSCSSCLPMNIVHCCPILVCCLQRCDVIW